MGIVLVRYGEIGLKGDNRQVFTRRLRLNIKDCLKRNNLVGQVRIVGQRLWVECDDVEQVADKVAHVMGIVSVSPAERVGLRVDSIITQSLLAAEAVQLVSGQSFRVKVRRSNKGFPMTSPDLAALVGEQVMEASGASVDLSEAADLTIGIEISSIGALVWGKRVPGPGGLPLNSQGRVVALLSGGIDSPVAMWMMMRRGCAVIPVHFSQNPVEAAKALDNCRALEQYSYGWFLQPVVEDHTAMMDPIVERLRELRADRYTCVFCKRAMLRRAGEIAAMFGAHAIVTGDSLGQVASQTLHNMEAISCGVSKPVLRPLIGMDKSEVMAMARRIGTYDVSIREAVGCRYVPEHPITMSEVSAVQELAEKVEDPRERVEDRQHNDTTTQRHADADLQVG